MSTAKPRGLPAVWRIAAIFAGFLLSPFSIILSAQQVSDEHTPAERLILSKLPSGEYADLNELPAGDRVVHAAFLEELLAGSPPGVKIHWRGVRIRHAVFDEWVNLAGGVVPYQISIVNSEFKDGLDCANTHFQKGLDLRGDQFKEGTHTRSNDLPAADFNATEVAGDADFEDTVFGGFSVFTNAEFSKTASFERARFESTKLATFNHIGVKSVAHFDGAVFDGPVVFMGAEIGEQLVLGRARFKGHTNSSDFSAMKIGRDLLLVGTVFEGPAKFDASEMDGQLGISEAQFDEGVSLDEIKTGMAIIVDTAFKKSLSIWDARLGKLTLKWKDPQGSPEELGISRTTIQSELNIDSLHAKRFFALRAQVQGAATLNKVEIAEEVDLTGAHFGRLALQKVQLPKEMKKVSFDHVSYDELNTGDGPRDWEKPIEDLEKSKYSRDNYTRLESYFNSHGYSERANEVFVHMKRRERREQLGGWWSPRWMAEIALDGLVRYGRSPGRALLWSLLVVAAGILVFRREADMVPQKEGHSPLNFSSFWYSLDLFVPAINLGVADGWMPRQGWFLGRNYARVHRILGWILVPIGLAAMAGLIK